MPDKKMKKKAPPEDMYQEGDKIGLKDQKPVREESSQMDARWKKVAGENQRTGGFPSKPTPCDIF